MKKLLKYFVAEITELCPPLEASVTRRLSKISCMPQTVYLTFYNKLIQADIDSGFWKKIHKTIKTDFIIGHCQEHKKNVFSENYASYVGKVYNFF